MHLNVSAKECKDPIILPSMFLSLSTNVMADEANTDVFINITAVVLQARFEPVYNRLHTGSGVFENVLL